MLRGKLRFVVVLLSCRGASASESTEHRTRKKYDINYRQVEAPMMDVLPPTTWSPTHPTSGALVPVPSTSHSPVSPHPPLPPPPPPPPPSHTSSPTQLLISLVPPSTPSASLASTPSAPAFSPSQATDIISITALPPLDPSSVPRVVTYPKKKPTSSQPFKLIYLTPIFAVVGVLWGSLTAWFVYGCLTRKPRVRAEEDETVPGPRYVPAGREEGEGEGEEGRGARGRGDLEGGALLRDEDGDEDEDGMHEVALEWPGVNNEKAGMTGADNPFLTNTTPAKPRSTRTKSAVSTSAYSDAMSIADTMDESRFVAPWESLRHHSIRRGILEQVQKEGHRIDALRRPATGTLLRTTAERRPSRHTRMDSDLLVGDVVLPDRTKESTYTYPDRPASHRQDSAYTTLSVVSSADKTQWRPGAGFRIVPESPAPPRAPTPVSPDDAYTAPSVPTCTSTSRTPAWWEASDRDRYTPLPTRHSNSRPNSASNSPVKGRSAPTTPERNAHARVQPRHPHASVLPQSPPQITSPLLENELCFMPTLTPSLASPPRTRTRTPAKTPTRNHNNAVNRSGGQIPAFIADINSPRPDVYRRQMVRSPPKSRPSPMASKTSSSSSTVSYTRDTEGRAVRQVEDIVEQGRGARELGMRSSSPTGFGRSGGR
ncbi:hypothetical protein LshimejAT787_1200810 [Lyophyllum shimeji]|uniref:Transmembrane protein n=1 Tax=Lyophyllum shimeji TaxID=47721 RepID=A0A9P3PWM9_LYOSH|nr:hypothetical protein LshimejAT787_1200810 [Lyophyllum shimeji]